MKEYKLPFGYLSYTQYRTWKESRKEYWEKYVIGEKMFETPGLQFGKRVSIWLEDSEKGDLSSEEEKVVSRFTLLDRPEEDEYVKMDDNGLVLRIKLDTSTYDRSEFGEYKTG